MKKPYLDASAHFSGASSPNVQYVYTSAHNSNRLTPNISAIESRKVEYCIWGLS